MNKEQETYVFNIQHYSLHDGPGIRTILFFKGCPMRCRWCCNPESQKYHPEISYVSNKCIGKKECGLCGGICSEKAITFPGNQTDRVARIERSKCTDCLKCAAVCPSKAIKIEGVRYSISQLLDIVERDAVFYGHGDGGLTISGGEPLTHPGLLIPILREAKRRKIHTAIETCGCADYEVLREAAPFLDVILYDIKSMNSEKHKEYTGHDNGKIQKNFIRLCEEFPRLKKKVRTPVIPGFNDTLEDIEQISGFCDSFRNVEYELLPYHSFGKGKYAALGRDYPMGDAKLDKEALNIIKECSYSGSPKITEE